MWLCNGVHLKQFESLILKYCVSHLRDCFGFYIIITEFFREIDHIYVKERAN